MADRRAVGRPRGAPPRTLSESVRVGGRGPFARERRRGGACRPRAAVAEAPRRAGCYPFAQVTQTANVNQRFPSGSIPPFLIAAEARSDARKAISRFPASASFDPATTAAANV